MQNLEFPVQNSACEMENVGTVGTANAAKNVV
jgi:hypothetical protein